MKTKSNPRTGGFTLIEMMIVVAIIGVLVGVALPSYQKFVIKAKVTDAVAATHPLKLALVDYAVKHGSVDPLLSISSSWSKVLKELGVSTNFFGNNSGYVKNAWWSPSASEIRVSVANIDSLEGRRFVLRATNPSFPTAWVCVTDDSNDTLIPSEYLPSFCQASGVE